MIKIWMILKKTSKIKKFNKTHKIKMNNNLIYKMRDKNKIRIK